MKSEDRRWLWALAFVLLAASVAIYAIQIALFEKTSDTFFYVFQDLAFLPLTVLIVGLLIERLISIREKRLLVHKMNMVVGIFFSETGTPLLAELLPTMQTAAEIREQLHLKASWKSENFAAALRFARSLDCKVDLDQIDRAALRDGLVAQRPFMFRLLENPNLLEHERFTDLLWAVHHLEEELEARTTLSELTPADEAHLEIDIRRAFNALAAEWVVYVQHLKSDYPYLFSLVVRTHPFQDSPSPIVTA